MQKFKAIRQYIMAGVAATLLCTGVGCRKGFLDTVPDNLTTLSDVFSKRALSEQWLARIYSALPDMWQQPYAEQWNGMSDEIDYTPAWLSIPLNNGALVPDGTTGYWQSYYQAIRYAGIFLQNIDKNKEIQALPNGPQLIQQYKGEARFLRAYYYYLLMKIYGPVVLMGEEPGTVTTNYQRPRSSWSECVAYVLSEMEKAKQDVADQFVVAGGTDIDHYQTGRITRGIVMAAESQVLLYDASPLYNGNADLADFKNADGKQLISQAYDQTKWKKAVDAAKAVIDLNKWQLYQVADPDPFKAAYLSCRNLFWDGCNTEGIWLRPGSSIIWNWEQHCSPRVSLGNAWNGIGVTQEMVDAFRMNNGLAIADPASGYTETGFTSTAKSGFYVTGTSNMYINREPRFYVDMTFTGATIPVIPMAGQSYVQFYYSGNCGKNGAPRDWTKTGYTARKNIHPSTNFSTGASQARPAMMIRLAEIYLNYAEALNESNPGNPDILVYLNRIRNRGGLPSLSTGLSQDAMRTQIRLERHIELAFEQQRYFDVRRWKVADQPGYYQGGQYHGMNMDKGNTITDAGFYQRTVDVNRSNWVRKNYFWPVPQSEMDRNKMLVQFPGY
jgi:hypothetical protein